MNNVQYLNWWPNNFPLNVFDLRLEAQKMNWQNQMAYLTESMSLL